VLLRPQDFFLFSKDWIIVWQERLGSYGFDYFFEVIFDFEQERVARQMQTEKTHCSFEVLGDDLKHPCGQASV
jgi:hypothetical protein